MSKFILIILSKIVFNVLNYETLELQPFFYSFLKLILIKRRVFQIIYECNTIIVVIYAFYSNCLFYNKRNLVTFHIYNPIIIIVIINLLFMYTMKKKFKFNLTDKKQNRTVLDFVFSFVYVCFFSIIFVII